MSIEEFGFGLIGFEPVAMQQEAVDLIGEDKLFKLDTLAPERTRQRHGLGEGDVAVIIALDEQDR